MNDKRSLTRYSQRSSDNPCIAQGLTQQELAERLGLKKQQIQRWEDEDYEHAEFWRVLEVADALGLSLTGKAKLAQATRPNLEAIKGCVKRAGMDADFVDRCLVPRGVADDPAAAAATVGVRMKAIWGFGIEDMLAANSNETLQWKAVANARFKRPANADPKTVTAQEGFSACLLKALCDVTAKARQPVLPANPVGMRRLLFGNQPPSFRRALDSVWKLGIPVLPLANKGGFHGACYRFSGRPAIALKQSLQSQARWLFDLTHELGHLVEHDDPTLRVIEPEEPSDEQDPEAEARVHDFAAKVLLGSYVDQIFPEVWKRARSQPERLKQVTATLAEELSLEVGLVAQHVAFRVLREHGENWWGAARNLEAAVRHCPGRAAAAREAGPRSGACARDASPNPGSGRLIDNSEWICRLARYGGGGPTYAADLHCKRSALLRRPAAAGRAQEHRADGGPG